MAKRDVEQKLELFLIGKTGNGKSETGNALVGRKAFETSDNGTPDTLSIQGAWARHEGRSIHVIDGPGACETRFSKGDAAKKMHQDMYTAILQCPEGFNALVLVLKYNQRFTEEEGNTVKALKSMFGANFVKDFCILVFTFGELFDMKYRGTTTTFIDWCQKQDGDLQRLLGECNYRAVLFYNQTPEKFDEQRRQLLHIIDTWGNSGVRYSNKMFTEAAKMRERYIVEENAPELKREIQQNIDFLMNGISKLKFQHSDHSEEAMKDIARLKTDASDLNYSIGVKDKGTEVLSSLRVAVRGLIQQIELFEDGLKQKKNTAELQKALDESMKKHFRILAELRQKVIEKESQRWWAGKLVDWLSGSTIYEDSVRDLTEAMKKCHTD